MDPKIVKKTQDTLGKIIKKPPLTEKLLNKPPFRFLHDIVTSVVKTTGFMQGLFTDGEMNSENVKDKDTKCAFLQKEIDFISAVLGRSLSAKPAKIVAGHEPEKTNELLQGLAEAINKNVDNDEYVKKVLRGGGGSKEEKKEKDRTKSADRRKSSKDKEDRHEEKRDRDRSRDKDRDRERKHDREDRDDRDRRHEKDRDRDRKERHKDRERDRDRDGDKESSKSRDKSRDGRDEKHRDRSRRRDQSGEKENESPATNGEREDKQDTPARLARPASAKGSRRRREEDEEFHTPAEQQPIMGEDALPPQVAAARLARPSSARPAPPRPKQDAAESEPAMRLGTGAPANLIVDNANDDDDEDLNFLVEESAPAPEPTMTLSKPQEEEDEDHGALVKKMLESKKELEGGSINQQAGTPKKTEIERPVMSDAQRRKQRELVQKEVDKLRASIQGLTRSANPLGKVMDYVQEDLDSMQQELDKWRAENAQHALDLRRETSVTDRAIEPLRQQLAELEVGLGDQLGQIAAVKANILRNDTKISKMLRGIAGS